MSFVRIKDGRMDRTVPVESRVGTIELDLSGDDVTLVLPPDASVTVEHE